MSDVESSTDPILKPMLKGQPMRLAEFEQVALTAWIVLRTMILERAAAAKKPRHFFTKDERRAFADYEHEGLMPPAGMYIWLVHFKSHRWVARSHVANMGLHATEGGPPHDTQVVTGIVGQFGFQALTCRWPTGRSLEFRGPQVAEWDGATQLLWPHTAGEIMWPPDYLADDTLQPFMDRWTNGISLTKPSAQ